MRRLALLIALILVTPALTGCLGFGGEDGGQDGGLETKSRADVSSQTGGIEGVVTDEAIQAVENANVTLVEIGEETQTAADGSFAFSKVQPGSYTIKVEAGGFISTERTVEVSQNEVSTLEIVLAHEPTVQPYSQQFEFKGFLECSTHTVVVGIAVCSIPNIFFENSTNDRFIFFHETEPNAWQMVTELQWEPTQPTAERMVLIVEPEGIYNDNDVTFAEDEGSGPIVLNTGRERMVEVIENLQSTCEEEDATGSNEEYCNRRYIEEGGTLAIRVFVEGMQQFSTPEGNVSTVGVALQQPFTIINTIFYNTPACEDYSVFEDNTCPQQKAPPEDDPADRLSGTNNSSSGNRTA